MKVMQINCVYRKGSTGKIVYDIHTELQARDIESVVCYGRGDEIEGSYRVCSDFYAKMNHLRARVTGLMYGGCLLSTRKVERLIQKEAPDVVHLHCINGYFVNIYRLIAWLKKNKIPTVLTLHAELMHTANCGYAYDCEKWMTGCKGCTCYKRETESLFFNRTHTSWRKMQKAFEGFENLQVVSVSPWLMNRAKRSPILGAFAHSVVLNGIDTTVFQPADPKPIREKYAPNGEKLIFYAAAAFSDDPEHVKGGYYVLKLAERFKGENVKLLVAAGTCAKPIDWPENITFLGSIRDQKLLAEYYSAADVCLLTSKRETFSMPTAESLSCGTPVVGFEAGAPETITLPEHSCFVKHADVDALEAAMRSFLKCEKNTDEIATKAAAKYAKGRMAEDYIAVYQRLLKKEDI